MRKIYIALLSFFILLGLSTRSTAQLSNYVFTQTSGTYTPISGGTVLITATSNAFGNAGFPDDQIYTLPAGTIPFTFTFNGTGYTGLHISANGFVAFGPTAPAFNNYTPISNVAAYSGVISAFGRDASGMFNVGGNTSELSYTTEGTAPDREFVIQYKNWRPYATATTSPFWTWNFQIRLIEGSNTARIVYGSCVATGTPTASTAQVGLRGATNADFANRTSTSNWSATTAGATNTATVSYSASNLPPSGLTFSWALPPCVPSSLGGGTATGPSGAVCPGVNFSLSVTGGSFGNGLTYQWESSPDNNVPWTPISGATSASLTTTQSSATLYYRRKMTCSGSDAYSTSIMVTATPPISSFPWTEGFNATTIPSCWSNQYVTGTTNWTYPTANGNNTITPRSGARMAEFRIASFGPSTKLVTPQLDLSSLSNPRLKFYYANVNWDGDVDELRVYYKNSTGGAWVQIGPSYVTEHTTWTEVVLSLPNPSSEYFIAFEGTSNWARGLDLDDVTVEETPPCVPPTGISVSGLTTISATLNWLASATPPASGYEWEIRTSGAAGIGPSGLAASGSTAAGVLTANATGLAANTQYTLYVRSACSAGVLYSDWSTGVNFATPCNPVTTFPFTETFETGSTTRACWGREIITGAFNWTYGAGAGNGGSVTTAHGGSVNARYFGNTWNGEKARLVSPELNLSGMVNGADLEFWYANESWLGDINELRVYYKTSAAGAWTLIPGAVYTSSVSAWTRIKLNNLPNINSTYYIAFEGTQFFGWGVAIDDVVVKEAPSCREPENVSALSITSTSANVYFTSPGAAFIVEYGAPGFTPGVANTAGTGGTLVFGASSPITIPGLTASTTYDVYIRRVCTPGVDFSVNEKVSVTTLCAATNIPYVQNFESAVTPGMPTCTSVQDVNGSSGVFWFGTGGGAWETYQDTDPATVVSPSHSLLYFWDGIDMTRPADDWFFTQGLNLTAGTSYRLTFYYKALDGITYPEGLEVKYGTAASAATMTSGTLFTNGNINLTSLDTPFDSARVDFTPSATGVYYIGFHANSAADRWGILVDDISVKVAPLVDVGVAALAGIPTCPGNTALQATIRNYNITPLNFATYPVTVTASFTGASTGTISTTINTGTLAPGATMTVNLPGFNYVAGLYNATVTTVSSSDPETANDAYSTAFYVNPSPAAAVTTPAAPAICAGNPVQLNTQFVTPPPPPVTHPAVASGEITVAIPDNSAAGVAHSLNVTGVPVTATITGISVTINATHTWVNDLQLNLRAPNGRILNLFNRKGGIAQANITNMVISSAATAPIPTTGAPFTGTWAADAAVGVGPSAYASNTNSFSDLMQIANGTWTLAIRDNANLDVGTLRSWSITITYGTPHPKVTWTPVTGLFTDPAATTAYTAGTDAYSVYANPAATTTYTVTSTSSAGCISTSTVTVTVNPNPVIAISALPARICISDTLVALTATPVGGTWSGIGISGTDFVPPATAVGTYTLSYSYTNNFGCTTVGTTAARVEECPERVVLLRDDAVILYPNPNNGQFNIRINSTLYNRLTMRVYTTNGTLVRTQQFSGLVFGRVVPIDLRSMPSGSYMVQFSNDGGGVRTSEKAFKVIIAR